MICPCATLLHVSFNDAYLPRLAAGETQETGYWKALRAMQVGPPGVKYEEVGFPYLHGVVTAKPEAKDSPFTIPVAWVRSIVERLRRVVARDNSP